MRFMSMSIARTTSITPVGSALISGLQQARMIGNGVDIDLG
jgi:hypothetical protein